jgi:hypothetical protein
MIDINKEAEEYANSFRFISESDSWFNNKYNSFIAGHNSKATQAKVIQTQIDVLEEVKELVDYKHFESVKLEYKIHKFQQQLKNLENG